MTPRKSRPEIKTGKARLIIEAAWKMLELDEQAQARIRFGLMSDENVEDDSRHVDDVFIRGLSVNSDSIFADGFETGTDA